MYRTDTAPVQWARGYARLVGYESLVRVCLYSSNGLAGTVSSIMNPVNRRCPYRRPGLSLPVPITDSPTLEITTCFE
jgi:hypothetical protein